MRGEPLSYATAQSRLVREYPLWLTLIPAVLMIAAYLGIGSMLYANVFRLSASISLGALALAAGIACLMIAYSGYVLYAGGRRRAIFALVAWLIVMGLFLFELFAGFTMLERFYRAFVI